MLKTLYKLDSGNRYYGRAGVCAGKSKLFDSDAYDFKLSPAAGVKFHTFSENARTPARAITTALISNLGCLTCQMKIYQSTLDQSG